MEATTNHPHEQSYSISTDKSKLDVNVIHGYLTKDSYWAQNIPMEVVRRSIDNSFCFGLYHDNAQVGFARLVTDRATFAYLADVFVLPEHRGKGLSKWMISVIQSHPDVQGLRRWMLGTLDAHGLYKQFGWSAIPEELWGRFMQIHNPDVYKKTDNG